MVAFPAMVTAQADLTKTLTTDVAGIAEVRVDTRVADVRLKTASGSRLAVTVVLDSRDTERLAQCARSELRARRDGSTLRLTLAQPGREHCHEKWHVEIPTGIAIDATVHVGSIEATLRDRYGDVDVRSDVGKAAVDWNGHLVRSTKRSGASESIRLEGEGRPLTLRSKVGNVDAVVTLPQD
jgi:hypothetical protein